MTTERRLLPSLGLVSFSILPAQPSPSHLPLPTRSVVLVRGGGACDAPRQGSGVVVAPGMVATNAHVVGESRTVTVWKDGHPWPANLAAMAPDQDLCLLSVPGLPLPPALPASPDDLRLGEGVIAVGYPGGDGPRSHRGRVTHLWSYCGATLIQSDAETQRGSSGGGLFTKDGLLLGITTFVFHASDTMNFSLPHAWIDTLLKHPRGTLPPSRPCRPMGTILRDFLGEMSQDPSNWPGWEHFTRTWVAGNPKDPDAWTALGYALHRKLEAQAAANVTLNRQLLEESTQAATHAIQLDPSHARAWNNLGVAMDLENRFEEAERAFSKAVDLDPGYAMGWFNLGSTRINARRYPAAIEAIHRGLAIKGDEPRQWAMLALGEARLGRWKDAAAHLEIALRYRPSHAPWWLDRAEACFQAGFPEAYRAALTRLEALDPASAAKARSFQRQLTPSR